MSDSGRGPQATSGILGLELTPDLAGPGFPSGRPTDRLLLSESRLAPLWNSTDPRPCCHGDADQSAAGGLRVPLLSPKRWGGGVWPHELLGTPLGSGQQETPSPAKGAGSEMEGPPVHRQEHPGHCLASLKPQCLRISDSHLSALQG